MQTPEEADRILDDILDTCESAPEECLAKIDALDQTLRNEPGAMFSRFLALRQLALAKFYAAPHEVTKGSYVDISPFFTPQHLDHAEAALHQVADIERMHSGYLDSLGTPEDRFAIVRIDGLGDVLEQMRPGKVQEILGWTKLRYFGDHRIGVPKTVSVPADLSKAIREQKVTPSGIARSAVVISAKLVPPRAVKVMFLEHDFRSVQTIGDANMLGDIDITEDGTAPEAEVDRSGLDHPNRDHILSEFTMLLKYEKDPARRRYMEDTTAWLEGRGPHPGEAPRVERTEAASKFTQSAILNRREGYMPSTAPIVDATYTSSSNHRSKTMRLAVGLVSAALLGAVTLAVVPHDKWPTFLRFDSSSVSAPTNAASATPVAGSASGIVYATRLTHIRNGPTSVGTTVIGDVQSGQAISGRGSWAVMARLYGFKLVNLMGSPFHMGTKHFR